MISKRLAKQTFSGADSKTNISRCWRANWFEYTTEVDAIQTTTRYICCQNNSRLFRREVDITLPRV